MFRKLYEFCESLTEVNPVWAGFVVFTVIVLACLFVFVAISAFVVTILVQHDLLWILHFVTGAIVIRAFWLVIFKSN